LLIFNRKPHKILPLDALRLRLQPVRLTGRGGKAYSPKRWNLRLGEGRVKVKVKKGNFLYNQGISEIKAIT
jgi:hypothetical protein